MCVYTHVLYTHTYMLQTDTAEALSSQTLCMYVCTYVCMYLCMYVYIYIYIYILDDLYAAQLNAATSMYVCMYVCMYIERETERERVKGLGLLCTYILHHLYAAQLTAETRRADAPISARSRQHQVGSCFITVQGGAGADSQARWAPDRPQG